MQVRLKPDTTNTEARSITSAAIITYVVSGFIRTLTNTEVRSINHAAIITYVVSGFSRTRHRIRMLRHEYYVLSKRDARSTAGSSRPAWKVRPLDVLVSHTSAGLKSIGSIL